MIRPATPGTLLTLAGAVLLGLVTISTPIWKSVYFLKATIGGQGAQRGAEATLGTLGYCIAGNCSSPTIGYEFNPNELLGINIVSAKYTSAVIKGLTYTLVLHPVALGLAAISVVFGLISHCREMSLNCLPICFSSFAAVVTAIAFGLDLALFIIARNRINSVNGASAELGSAVWMTLAAWILLFLSGFTFCCGRGSRRRRNRIKDEYANEAGGYGQRPIGQSTVSYGDQMRLQALDAEADRKQRQADWDRKNSPNGEPPKFAEYETEYEVPLKKDYEDGAYAGAVAQSDLSFSNGVAAMSVPGVGAGYGRRNPSVNTYAAPPQNNAAGHGAHSIRSDSDAGAGMVQPMAHGSPSYHDDGYTSTQPHGFPMATGPGGAESYGYSNVAASNDPVYAAGGARRQATGEYGHPTEYSGATFGGVAGHGGAGQYSSYEPSSTYPQRQPSETGSRVRSPPRTLPAIPPVSPIDQGPAGEIPYGGTSAVASSARRQPTQDANDGFGIGLTAAAATLASGSRRDLPASEDGYGHYASSAYDHGHGHERSGTHHENVRNRSVSGSHGYEQQQQQQQYEEEQEQLRQGYHEEGHSSAGPPEYASAVGDNDYTHSPRYPQEKGR